MLEVSCWPLLLSTSSRRLDGPPREVIGSAHPEARLRVETSEDGGTSVLAFEARRPLGPPQPPERYGELARATHETLAELKRTVVTR